ncbi:pentapeptide repeat-containing protein [Paenibacillus terreus]|uniref:pentapeptide repeat-containing protein n=1 Tax=Paenibacillus terreus TaxID=1387834 RepID=UPI0035CD159A
MQQEENKNPIAYIHYSLLRTQLLEQTYQYSVEAYDDVWYEDETDCVLSYDASWAYTPFAVMLEKLERERKKYMGNLNASDIERLMLQAAPFFHQFVLAALRLSIHEMVQLPEYQGFQKAPRLLIRCGEYMDLSENVYVEDQAVPSLEEVEQKLASWTENKAAEEEGGKIIYENFKNLALPELNVTAKDLRYNDFSGSQLTASRFLSCILAGTRWYQANLAGCSFENCLITDADFSRSNLEGANFQGSSAKPVRENGNRTPGLCGTRFDYANLDGANFEGVFLEKNTSFTGASMSATRMPVQYQDQLKFTEVQLQGIQWIE